MKITLNTLKYEDIRQNMKDRLITKYNLDAQFDFEGSNLAFQLDIGSYMLMQLGYYTSMKSNNIFMDTTEIRKNAVSIGRSQGYKPKRKVSARFPGSIEYIDSNHTFHPNDTIIIPSRTAFISSPGSLIFTNIEPINLTFKNEIMLSGDFSLSEGRFRTVTDFGDGTAFQEIDINSKNIENTNISLAIGNTNNLLNTQTLWREVTSYFTTKEMNIFFVSESLSNDAASLIRFGDGDTGNIPGLDQTITIEYLETVGSTGNDQTGLSFTAFPSFDINNVSSFVLDTGLFNIDIPIGVASSGGKDEETLQEIKFNAPKFVSSGDRGVNANDINSLISVWESILMYYNYIAGSKIFPNNPNLSGYGYITGVPYFNFDDFLQNEKIFLTELEENTILPSLIDKTIVATRRNFLKPTFIYSDLAPTIEVETFLKDEEKELIKTASFQNAQTIEKTFRGFNKVYRVSQINAAFSNTNQVLGAETLAKYYFIINLDTFYNTRATTLNLPVIFLRESNGDIIYNDNEAETSTNYIKKRSLIIEEENEKRNIPYTQFDFPINMSSIYGSLIHKNSDRYMYNKDVNDILISKFELLTSGSDAVLKFESQSFENQDGVEYVSNLSEIGFINEAETIKSWKIQLNGANVGELQQPYVAGIAQDIFSIVVNETEEIYLEDIGFQIADSETDILLINKINEIDENDNATEYYAVTGSLSNEEVSNLFLYGKTKALDAVFNPTSFTWTISNTKTYLDDNENESMFEYDENELNEMFINLASFPIFSLENDNGTFSLNNFLNDEMVQYSQRNDLEFIKNFEIEQIQNPSNEYVNYNVGEMSYAAEANSLQINLLEEKHLKIVCISNGSDVLDGRGFYLREPETNTQFGSDKDYYVWINSMPARENDIVYSVNDFVYLDNLKLECTTAGTSDSSAPSTTGLIVDDTLTEGPDTLEWTVRRVGVLDDIVNTAFTAGNIELVEVDVSETADTAEEVSNEIMFAINLLDNNSAELDFTVTKDSADTLLINYNHNGKTTDIEEESNLLTGSFNFTQTYEQTGAYNIDTDITNLKEGDYVQLNNSLNDGIFSIFEATSDYIKIYIYDKQIDLTGLGSLTHYRIASGEYGSYSIYTYDLYHNISIGTFNYNSGNINFFPSIKGYIGLEENKTIIRNIRNIFDNYNDVNKMDTIRLIPIDRTKEGDYLGPDNDFDSRFNTFVVTNIQQPLIKK